MKFTVYRLVTAAVALGTDIDSRRYASMEFAYRIVAMDSNQMVAVDSNSYLIHLNAFPATVAHQASVADSIVVVDCN